MKIYLIRHGQSQANERDLFLGHGDLDLTPKGYEQAKLTAKYLSKFSIDKIYSSDLMRAYHTALSTSELIGVPVIKDKELREIDCGEWDFMPFSELKERYKESFSVWLDNVAEARCDGGESVEEVQKRMVNAVERIAKENYGKTVAIFSHATSIKCFVGYCTGKGKYGVQEIPWASNASVTELEYENGVFKLIEYGRDDFMGDICTALPDKV